MVRNRSKDIKALQIREVSEQTEGQVLRARRTAFVARFVVLREAKKSKAHRYIERLTWDKETSAEELADIIRGIFRSHGENMEGVEKDLSRALSHASRSISFFIPEYAARATTTFLGALVDYEVSNALLFAGEDQPKQLGWRNSKDVQRELQRVVVTEATVTASSH